MSARDPLKRLQNRIKQDKSYLRPPLRDVGSVNARRGRVKRLLCQRGRVCSGTPPCPCWEPVEGELRDQHARLLTISDALV